MLRNLRDGALCSVLAALSLLPMGCSPSQPTMLPTSQSATPVRSPRPTFTTAPTVVPPATLVPTMTPAPREEEKDSSMATPNVGTPTAMSSPSDSATDEPTVTPSPEDTATPVPTDRPRALTMSSPEYGMQAFLWWRPEVASRDLQAIRDAGFTWCKVNFGWRDIEGAGKGVHDWSRTDRIVQQAGEVGVDLVVRVDHQPAWSGGGFPTNGPPDNRQDYADFMGTLASRYRGRIRAYEVWNEPNLSREWGDQLPDPDGYVKMLGLAYRAIKAADPGAMVISAGLSPTGSWTQEARPDDWFLESMYVVMGGTSAGYFDVLGAHGAGYKSPPERDPAEVGANADLGGHRSLCFRRVEDLRAIMVRAGDAGKQIALLEFGWTSDMRPGSPYAWHGVSEETKADYMVRAYQYAEQNWAPWIGLMSLIYISDPDWTQDHEQYWWAITYPGWPELKPRPAYNALKAMAK